jgi:hypothetical protein
MKKDGSKKIYENFVRSKNKHAEVTFKNNQVESGTFVGFFVGDKELSEPYILGWHFIADEYWESYIFNSVYFGNGKIISSSDIKKVKFSSERG